MIEGWARALVRHRAAVLVLLGLLATWGGTWALRLEARFDPAALVAVDEDVRAQELRLAETFPAAPSPIVIVLDGREEGTSLLSTDALLSTHALAHALAGLDAVAVVESLTTSRLPREPSFVDEAVQGGATLEALEAEGDHADDHSALAVIVSDIVAAEPRWFPSGLLSVGGPLTFAPVGRGPTLSVEEAERARQLIRSSPLLERRLVSEDGQVAIVAVVPRHDADELTLEALLTQVRRLALEHAPARVHVSITGLPAMRDEMTRALRDDQAQLVGLAVLGTIVVLVLGMRSRAGVALPLATVGIALALSLGVMAACGMALDLLTNMLPPLLLTIGLAEAMHMVLRHQEEVNDGRDSVEAAVEIARTMWLPCFVTTFTTAIGFAALVVAESSALQGFGAIAATATMITYAVTVVFVPAALPYFTTAPSEVARARVPRTDGIERALVWLAAKTSARPWRTVLVAAIVGAVSGALSQHLVIESRLLDQFARGSELARSSATLESELDGFRSVELAIYADPGAFHTARGLAVLDAIARTAREQDDVLRVSTASDVVHEALARLAQEPSAREARVESDVAARGLVALIETDGGQALRAYLTEDGASARVELRVRDSGAMRTLELVERLQQRAEQALQEEELRGEVSVAGEAFAASRGLERIVRALGGLAVALITIFVVMALLFRSVRLGLLAIPPNALPLAVTLAYMVLRDIPLHAATVIVFTVTAGLAVDGTTHVVSRFREELERAGPQADAALVLERTVTGSGRAVLLSSVTLLVGYVALLTSRFEPVRLFGELSLVAIGAATLSQTLLLPAMLSLWGTPRGGRTARAATQSESRPSSDDVNAPSSGK